MLCTCAVSILVEENIRTVLVEGEAGLLLDEGC